MNRILIFDNASKSFNKAYTHIGGRFDISMAPPRTVFWHPLKHNYTFLEGIRIEPKWNSDIGIAVMDTLVPKYPIAVEEVQPEDLLITVFPNPSENNFFVVKNHKQKSECVIYSIEMRECERFVVEPGETYELKSLMASGLYFIQAFNNAGVKQTIKIIKP